MRIKPTDNFFFAVAPDAVANLRAQAVADTRAAELGQPGYWAPAACRHVSIAGVGSGAWVTEAILDDLRAMVDGFAAPAFRVALNRFESWPGRSRPWVLTGDEGVIGFQQLLDALRLKLKAAGFDPPWPATLTAHMTLARNGPQADPMLIPAISWEVTELVLIQSHVGEGRYTIVARWPLKALAPA